MSLLKKVFIIVICSIFVFSTNQVYNVNGKSQTEIFTLNNDSRELHNGIEIYRVEKYNKVAMFDKSKNVYFVSSNKVYFY